MKIDECFGSVMKSLMTHQRQTLNSPWWFNNFAPTSLLKILAHRRFVLTFREVVKIFFAHFPTRARIILLSIASMMSPRESKRGVYFFLPHVNLLDLERNSVTFYCFDFAILILLVGHASFFLFFSSQFLFGTNHRSIASFSLMGLWPPDSWRLVDMKCWNRFRWCAVRCSFWSIWSIFWCCTCCTHCDYFCIFSFFHFFLIFISSPKKLRNNDKKLKKMPAQK